MISTHTACLRNPHRARQRPSPLQKPVRVMHAVMPSKFYTPEVTLELVNVIVKNNDNAYALSTMTAAQEHIVNALLDTIICYEIKAILIVVLIVIMYFVLKF